MVGALVFDKILLVKNFEFKHFEGFRLLYQRVVSTLTLKKLQSIEIPFFKWSVH